MLKSSRSTESTQSIDRIDRANVKSSQCEVESVNDIDLKSTFGSGADSAELGEQ